MAEVVVIDDHLRAQGEATVKNAEKTEDSLKKMIDFLNKAGLQGIAAGNAHENFNKLASQIQRLRGEFEYLAGEEKKAIEDFVSKVDSADGYIY